MVSVSKGTAVAAGIGIGCGAISGYGVGKMVVNNANIFKEGGSGASAILREVGKKSSFVKYFTNIGRQILIDYRQMAITKKISPKFVGKAALISGLMYATGYLAYRGIKGLFTKSTPKTEKV